MLTAGHFSLYRKVTGMGRRANIAWTGTWSTMPAAWLQRSTTECFGRKPPTLHELPLDYFSKKTCKLRSKHETNGKNSEYLPKWITANRPNY